MKQSVKNNWSISKENEEFNALYKLVSEDLEKQLNEKDKSDSFYIKKLLQLFVEVDFSL